MRISIISDVHGIFPKEFQPFIADSDEIWCTGDIWSEKIYDEIKSLDIPVVAITGNWEEERQTSLLKILPKSITIEREGLKIYMTHKFQGNYLLDQKNIDIYCFGHIHRFNAQKVIRNNGKPSYLINPGALTPLYEEIASAVKIEINDGKLLSLKRMTCKCGKIGKKKGEDFSYYHVLTKNKITPYWIDSMFGYGINAYILDINEEEYRTYLNMYKPYVEGQTQGEYLTLLESDSTKRDLAALFFDIDTDERTIIVNGLSKLPDVEQNDIYAVACKMGQQLANDNISPIEHLIFPTFDEKQAYAIKKQMDKITL